ncbi:MAG TPA: DNA repair protein RecN [Dehalococcoidia bacterium]|nr:DNA repair protein RecN [Dehalococcoidia bacterium]
MLFELSVKNFAIIEEITWKPTGGLNVITGETGAGKSLVVDAVEALLSGQANEEDIRTDTDEAEIEGLFRLPDNDTAEKLKALLNEKYITPEEDSLIFYCVFRRQSRTTPRINRQAVPRALLKEIGAFLVDIHGQSGHLSLLDNDNHLEFLDSYAHNGTLRREFAEKVTDLHRKEQELRELSKKANDFSKQTELLTFQINEIRQADLTDGEDAELETELTVLSSAEKLKATSYDVYSLLSGDDNAMSSSSAMDRLNDALPLLGRMLETDPSLKARFDRLESAAYELVEIAQEVKNYGEGLDYNPERLEELQGRLELIRTLKRKYGNSIEKILEYLVNAERELEDLVFSDERIEQLDSEINQLKVDMGELADEITRERVKAADKLEESVKKELTDLEMTGVEFRVDINRELDTDGLPLPDGNWYRYSNTGIDDVEFMASTNPGESMKPLAKIASTGEISRFMLALKCALAEADTIPVLVFDEIDIGVGGRSGEVIGRKLWNLSRTHQVTCVTHLPQIAAFADSHYSVTKASAGDRTVSNIRSLNEEERLNELAEMVSGPDITETALSTARELMQRADGWKKSHS